MGLQNQNPILTTFLLSSTLVITNVLAECTCEPQQISGDKTKALNYKLIAIASILLAGGIGVSLPFAGKIFPALHPEKDGFFVVKTFAAGVILATGFVHILPQAFDRLTSPCLAGDRWMEFPVTGFVAMMATLGTLVFETSAAAYQVRAAATKVVGDGDGDGQVHGSMSPTDDSEVRRYRIVSQVLEIGIVIHSVIIGLSLGASKSPKTIKPLIAALSFHQLFEGLGLGGNIFQVNESNREPV